MSNEDAMNVTLRVGSGELRTSEQGKMNLTVENNEGKSYYCKSVTAKIPVGDSAQTIYYNDNKTTFSQTVSGKTKSGRVKKSETDGKFIKHTFSIEGGGERPLSGALEFTIKGNVNSKPGTANVSVSYEYSEDGKDDSWSIGESDFSVGKETDDIYLYNFHTEKTGSAGTLCTCFEKGESIRFAWESNGDTYEIYAGSAAKAIYSGADTNFTYEEGITQDTTFMLKALKKEDGFSESMMMEAVTACTTAPEFSSLTVKDSLTVEGSVSLFTRTTQLSGIAEKLASKSYVTVQADSDGFLVVCMDNNASDINTRARVRATVYHDKKSVLSLQDDAYHVKVKCDGADAMELVHCTTMTLPICSGETCIVNCNMLQPSQSALADGYDLQMYFTPLGDGAAGVS